MSNLFTTIVPSLFVPKTSFSPIYFYTEGYDLVGSIHTFFIVVFISFCGTVRLRGQRLTRLCNCRHRIRDRHRDHRVHRRQDLTD